MRQLNIPSNDYDWDDRLILILATPTKAAYLLCINTYSRSVEFYTSLVVKHADVTHGKSMFTILRALHLIYTFLNCVCSAFKRDKKLKDNLL